MDSVSGEKGLDHLCHALGHTCEPCREIQRAGPKRPTNPLLRFYGHALDKVTTTGQHCPAVVPARSKRSLQNEVRRVARLKARRHREKRALVVAIGRLPAEEREVMEAMLYGAPA